MGRRYGGYMGRYSEGHTGRCCGDTSVAATMDTWVAVAGTSAGIHRATPRCQTSWPGALRDSGAGAGVSGPSGGDRTRGAPGPRRANALIANPQSKVIRLRFDWDLVSGSPVWPQRFKETRISTRQISV